MGVGLSLGSVTVVVASVALMGCTSLNGNDDWESEGDGSGSSGGDTVTVQSDVPPPNTMGCAYPQGGASGVSVGQVIPSSTSWLGLPPNEGERQFSLAEYFDCDNGKGVDAILVTTSQYG